MRLAWYARHERRTSGIERSGRADAAIATPPEAAAMAARRAPTPRPRRP
ncbi:hypothetical protein BURPS1106B_1257 [Burkholderia pseudomallei 1106b]|nr:hypothetical protein BPC006_II1809 [Burkholderia pseudomallei BPC006]EES21720.1 hypothetical protein BURPS1106B_0163 [Burkholderia pseudomallei 1106b]EES22048.1 hypothetical protein BURPS1106B_1267 [Burkholderia pseudomallei 1106b]EES22592.1 hypothetical protein BURPS1106B_0153 [Burkholderia pseudomallei 1106b]EES23130.1 hypothetical protein BURPS1106B_1257 [Burkholderia pseudomallei 1106b]